MTFEKASSIEFTVLPEWMKYLILVLWVTACAAALALLTFHTINNQ